MGLIIVCYDLPVIMRVSPAALLLPVVLFILSCSSEKPASATKPPDETAAIAALKEINRAQSDFIRRTRRYAQSFDELTADRLLASVPSTDSTGYQFSLLPSPDAVSYVLKATPAGSGRHFFTDQSGIIRSESDKPATAESPAVPN
jgi:hypothetical protein